jgi:catechol 2,3-dioxygenase-like lactoylglutathione lyase family enzyme
MDWQRVARMDRPKGLPFRINKIGHVVLHVHDIERSTQFYTEILGFKISDIYANNELPGGAVFLRCNADHHGIALFQAKGDPMPGHGMNHVAFEVSSLDEVVRLRDHLRKHNVEIDFHGRRRAGVQIAVEFRDPDGHRLEIYWGIDQFGYDDRARPAEEWKGASSLEQAVADPVKGQDTTLADSTLLQR